jgi:hypothetical protein
MLDPGGIAMGWSRGKTLGENVRSFPVFLPFQIGQRLVHAMC